MDKKQIITIAGRPGSGKSTTAKTVADKLGFKHFSSGDLFRSIAEEQGIDLLKANITAEQNSAIDNLIDKRLREIGKGDELVIDSRLAWHWMPLSFKVYLNLDLKIAAQRIITGMSEERLLNEHVPEEPGEYALALQRRLDSEALRYKALYDVNPYDLNNYDLVIDTAINGIEQVVGMVTKGFEDWLKS